jgi:hypothetical protein
MDLIDCMSKLQLHGCLHCLRIMWDLFICPLLHQKNTANMPVAHSVNEAMSQSQLLR